MTTTSYRSDALSDHIYEAAKQGDEIELRARLEQWRHYHFGEGSLFVRQNIVNIGLGHAVTASQVGSIRLLMEYGAKVVDYTTDKAVNNAVSTDVWQALLDGGWDPNDTYTVGKATIFKLLNKKSDIPTLVWLLSHGASVEVRHRYNWTAISWTAAHRPVSVLRALLEHSGYNSPDKLNRSNAVHEAAKYHGRDRTEALTLLVDELGADVNALSSYGRRSHRWIKADCRPLHQAMHSGRREHVRFLLDRGARVTDKDVEGRDVRSYGKYSRRPGGWEALEEWFAEKGLEVPGEEGSKVVEDSKEGGSTGEGDVKVEEGPKVGEKENITEGDAER